MLFFPSPHTHIPFPLTLPTKFRYILFFSTQLSGKDDDIVDEMREREKKKNKKCIYNMLIIILSLLSVASTISRCTVEATAVLCV